MNSKLDWTSTSLGEIITSRFREWIRSFERPNPWPDELDIAIRAPDAVPICHHCMTPCDFPAWFCPTCGAAVGPYNNTMPYIYIFSIGEALRSGVGPEANLTPFRATAYVVMGLMQYWVFAPLYFIRLYRNYRKLKSKQSETPQQSPSGNSLKAPPDDPRGRGPL